MAANGLTEGDAEKYADSVLGPTQVIDALVEENVQLKRELAAARAELASLSGTPPFGLTLEGERAIRELVAKMNAELAEGCLVVGKVYRHPQSDRLLRVTDGSFLGGYQRVSNFWTWRYLDEEFQLAGESGQGYGWKAEPVDEPEPCDHCGLLPNQQSDADEQCRVCGKGDDR